MTAILLSVLACAALDSLNPSVIGVTLYLLLSGPDRTDAEGTADATGANATATAGTALATKSRHGTTTRVLTYVGTVAATYLALGVALMLGLDALSSQLASAAEHPATYAAIGALGVGMFAWSWIDSARDKKHPDRHANEKKRLPVTDRLGALITLGLVVTVLEFSTALPFLAAIGLLTAANLGIGVWLPILVGYVVVMNLPPLLMLLGHLLLRDRIRARLERWRETLSRNSRKTVQWIVGIVGFLLARYGVTFLLIEFGVIDG